MIGNPTPEVMWLMDGQIIHPEDGEATFEQDVATLLLEDAMSEDSGKYECVATNSAGEARSSCHVQVLGEKRCVTSRFAHSVPTQHDNESE